MRCAACRHENPERAKFCLECGARLAASCPQCGTELPAGAKFCLECGHRVAAPPEAAAPPAAGSPPPGGSPAAPDVATRLAAYTPKHLAEKILKSRSALEGERRQVTVLFADLAGFTTLAERLDPEEVHRIIERCFELITAEARLAADTIQSVVDRLTDPAPRGVLALLEPCPGCPRRPRPVAAALKGVTSGRGDHPRQDTRPRMRIEEH